MLRKTLRAVLIVLAVLTLIVLGVTYQKAWGIVHPNRKAIDRTPADVGLTDFETVDFQASDGNHDRAWFVPPTNGAVIVFVHGLGGNRANLLPNAAILHQAGFGAMLIDLRSHGESEGELATFGLSEVNDVRGAVQWLEARGDWRLGILGQSMGASTTMLSAAAIPELQAVVEECGFTSMSDNISSGVRELAHLPPFPFAPLIQMWGEQQSGFDIDAVRPVDAVPKIAPRPLLIVHGDEDRLVPVENAHAIFAAAGEPKELLILPGVGHRNFVEPGGATYAEAITRFFTTHLGAQTAAPPSPPSPTPAPQDPAPAPPPPR